MIKKRKKKWLIVLFVVLLITGIVSAFFLLKDNNKPTILEKQWLTDNANTMINIGVINNINNFGSDGEGVFFDFINDVEKEYGISMNVVPYLMGNVTSGLSFKIEDKVSNEDLVFFEDHFVLVSTELLTISKKEDINNLTIGLLNTNSNLVKKYLNDTTSIFKDYETKDTLLAGLNSSEVTAIIVPLNEYLNTILANSLKIDYHFSDIKLYYNLNLDGERLLVSSIRKYFNKWMEKDYSDYYNYHNLATFTSNLNITEKDKDILTRKVYKYGFVEASPYETNVSGNYGGIIAAYLKHFSLLTNSEFKFIKYKKINKFINEVNKGNIDLYTNYYLLDNNYSVTKSIDYVDLSVITKSSNYDAFNSINSLKNKEVYVLKNSTIASYLSRSNDIQLKYYDNEKELIKLSKKDVIIALDSLTYEYYKNTEIKNCNEQFRVTLPIAYSFKVNGDATFYKLLDEYIRTLDPKRIENEGIYNYNKTVKSGTIVGTIAKYLVSIIVIGIVLLLLTYKYSKKVKISKKIKKEDKLKFIDQLTSLKNRNYLNENIDEWDKNTIYPQTIIVVDLNNVKYVNDTFGHSEGDKQIQSAANILIKTQLDNSDIIRSDGNEFIIYLIGYEEKQIVNYIRKLYKEFKKMPYEYGSAMGYSMITDDKKLLDDAINEATIAMRNEKENSED